MENNFFNMKVKLIKKTFPFLITMNKKIMTLFIGSILLMLTFMTADVKEKRGDDFLRINDNIQNEELRIELKGLKKEFNIERSRIQEYYNEKMEALKEDRQNEIKIMKADFAGHREIIMKKYVGEKHNNFAVKPTYVPSTMKNIPDQKKGSKDKKKNRTP